MSDYDRLQSLFNLPSLTIETSNFLRCFRVNNAIQALRNLDRAVEHWDDVFVFLVAQKLDTATRRAWELKLDDTIEYPRYCELDQFLESRIRVFDAIASMSSKEKFQTTSKRKAFVSYTASTVSLICPLCKTNHLLYVLKQTISTLRFH